jgi:hypothetical protein
MANERVIITKLMLKLQQVEQPNYMIAAVAHIHPTTLSQYARGLKPISAKHLVALCALFECQPDELLGETLVEVTG